MTQKFFCLIAPLLKCLWRNLPFHPETLSAYNWQKIYLQMNTVWDNNNQANISISAGPMNYDELNLC